MPLVMTFEQRCLLRPVSGRCDEPYAFQIPAGDIPNGYGSSFATGKYKSFIRYTAANFSQPLLRRGSVPARTGTSTAAAASGCRCRC